MPLSVSVCHHMYRANLLIMPKVTGHFIDML